MEPCEKKIKVPTTGLFDFPELILGGRGKGKGTEAKMGGYGLDDKVANSFIYAFGDAATNAPLMAISFDTNGKPVITTAPVVEGHTDFTAEVVGSESVGDWASPVTLQQSGDNWTLPAGKSANFFRVRLEE